ncbi:MAG: hypothetical protein IJ282_09330 [Lachnospiraceae bacterium]|nr:hypothetical protein [Lachnospiraceae bacterium]
MKKGNLGIRLAVYGVLAFVLAYFGSSTLLFLMLGITLLVEKNEWATRQIIQALVLCYASSLVRSVLNIFDFMYKIPYVGTVWSILLDVIFVLIEIAVLVFAVLGIIKNLKDQDAAIPVASSVADWVYGVAKEKTAPAAAPAPAAQAAPAPQAQAAPAQDTTQQ